MAGDNFSVRVVSEGKEHFAMAVRMAFANGSGKTVSHYINGLPERKCDECCGSGKQYGRPVDRDAKSSVEFCCKECAGTGIQRACAAMILLWHEESCNGSTAIPLPYTLTAEQAVDFLWNFISNCEYPPEPDHDGSNGKGFVVTTGNFWGHIEGFHYSTVMVQPDWQMYGK